MKAGDLLFVYGTLRRGESADLSNKTAVEFVGEDRINGDLYNLGWFPGVKNVNTDEMESYFYPSLSMVHGDVFRILDASITSMLDAYEGYPSLYGRSVVLSGEGRLVWVYTYNGVPQESQRISSGDWKTGQPIGHPNAYTAA